MQLVSMTPNIRKPARHKVSDFVLSSYYVPASALSILTLSANPSTAPSGDLLQYCVQHPRVLDERTSATHAPTHSPAPSQPPTPSPLHTHTPSPTPQHLPLPLLHRCIRLPRVVDEHCVNIPPPPLRALRRPVGLLQHPSTASGFSAHTLALARPRRVRNAPPVSPISAHLASLSLSFSPSLATATSHRDDDDVRRVRPR